jgi:hypothetical protein
MLLGFSEWNPEEETPGLTAISEVEPGCLSCRWCHLVPCQTISNE